MADAGELWWLRGAALRVPLGIGCVLVAVRLSTLQASHRLSAFQALHRLPTAG